MDRIPAVMATQHPNSATTYGAVQKELQEAIEVLEPVSRARLGILIDFEGKMTPPFRPRKSC